MKTIPLLFAFSLLSVAGFAQNMHTSTTMALPNVMADDKAFSEFAVADMDEEVSADEVFDKMALIESLVFSEEELHAKREKHLVKDEDVMFFQPSSH